ncbi:MAG TPA: TfoX/Sxy family protein [Terriglobales bacterium]|nr:TfoX/Sxy family protein [Terriglobales bacterium]
MGELWQLYNVSIVLEYQLNAAGIKSPADLRAMGSKEAFRRLRERDETLGADVLVSLEGATQGMRWYKLPKEVQQELRDYYEATYGAKEES